MYLQSDRDKTLQSVRMFVRLSVCRRRQSIHATRLLQAAGAYRIGHLSVGHFPLGHIPPDISPPGQFLSPPMTLPQASGVTSHSGPPGKNS